MPEPPLGVAWRLGDMLREYRGDAHIAAWTGAGFDPPEIGLLTELYWGLPPRSYVRTRAWTSDDLDAAEERLRSRGLLEADGSAMTEAGWAAREAVEVQTDQMCRPLTDALGEDADELVALLAPWGAEIRAQGGYLPVGPARPGRALRPPLTRRPRRAGRRRPAGARYGSSMSSG